MCFIYDGNITWMVSSIMDLKHLLKQIRNHKQFAVHNDNDVKLRFLVSVKVLAELRDCYNVSVWCYSELVDKNDHKTHTIIKHDQFCLTPQILLKAYDKIQVPNTVAISWSCYQS
jgi:hypothetical protein